MSINAKTFKSQFQSLISSFLKHDVMTLAAALAFYTTLSLAPLLMIFISLSGLIGFETQIKMVDTVRDMLGPNAAQAVEMIIQNAKMNSDVGLISAIVSIGVLSFSASIVFAQMQTSLDIIFDITPPRKTRVLSWIKEKLVTMGLVLAFLFLSMVSMALSVVISVLFTSANGSAWELINGLVSFATFTFLFALIYRFVTRSRLSWRQAIKGAMTTSAMFIAGKSLIGIYLGNSAVASAYGAAGAIIVFLLWVYYSSVIIFLGAEVTRLWYPSVSEHAVSEHSKYQIDARTAPQT